MKPRITVLTLHTSHFEQSIIYQYLKDNDFETHLNTVKSVKGKQCQFPYQLVIRRVTVHFFLEVLKASPRANMIMCLH